MLILAGVSISDLSNNGGIINRSILATKEFKKQNLIEVVKTAEIYVEMDNQFDRTKQIDIVSLINKVKYISDINERDYIITVDEVEQKATIIDKKMKIVIDIWIDARGNVTVDGNIVDNIEEIVAPTIEYTLAPPAGTYGEEVTITIVAKESKNGIAKTQFQNNAEKTYNNQKEVTETYTVTVNGTYTYTAIGANGRKANAYIEIKNIMNGADITLVAQETKPTNKPVNVVITYDENIKIGGATLINADRFQYSIGGTTWQTATQNPITVPVSVNGNIYARYYDGTQGYRTTSLTITNIDKEAPNAFNLKTTQTTNSITVSAAGTVTDKGTTGCAAGNIGITGYQFQLKNNAGTVLTPWTAKQAGTSYTFSNLTQGTTYKVSMRAVDKAGNMQEASNKDLAVILGTVADSSTKIGISYSNQNPTTGNVTVTFTDNSGISGLTLKYQKDSTTGTWTTYTGPVTMTANGKIYARLFDNKEQYTNTATATVANIDKEVPVISSATASTSWGATNSVTVKATDTGTTGCAAGNIGIIGYGINQSSTTAPSYTSVTATTSLSTTINNITANGTYYVWVKDKAGNTANKAVTVNRVDTTAPTTATIESSNVEDTTFTLTATGADGESGVAKYEFYINGTLEETVTTTAGSVTYNVTGKTGSTNYTCYVKVYDAAGKSKQSSSITVTTKSAGTPIAQVVSVGDYVNYDAGTWTEADFNKITSSAGSPTVNKSTNKPTTQGQFGGFTVGQSRNSNSTEFSSSWKPRTAGWRVWSIEGDVVTLISAGHPETYYHSSGNSSLSVNILRNRNCSMYENSYAQAGSAHFLTGEEATRWYNKQYGTSYDESKCLYDLSSFSTAEPISVLENGSYYWFASAYDSSRLYYVHPDYRIVNYYGGSDYGMRCAPPSFSTIWSPSRTRQWRRKRG